MTPKIMSSTLFEPLGLWVIVSISPMKNSWYLCLKLSSVSVGPVLLETPWSTSDFYVWMNLSDFFHSIPYLYYSYTMALWFPDIPCLFGFQISKILKWHTFLPDLMNKCYYSILRWGFIKLNLHLGHLNPLT